MRAVLLFALATFSTAALAQEEIEMTWSDLPTSGFLSGRAATNADVEDGRATFSMDGKSEGAMPIEIPQYAYWTDENGKRHPVIVVQAEQAPGGLQVVGLLQGDGAHAVATMAEVTLLGTKSPDE